MIKACFSGLQNISLTLNLASCLNWNKSDDLYTTFGLLLVMTGQLGLIGLCTSRTRKPPDVRRTCLYMSHYREFRKKETFYLFCLVVLATKSVLLMLEIRLHDLVSIAQLQ